MIEKQEIVSTDGERNSRVDHFLHRMVFERVHRTEHVVALRADVAAHFPVREEFQDAVVPGGADAVLNFVKVELFEKEAQGMRV